MPTFQVHVFACIMYVETEGREKEREIAEIVVAQLYSLVCSAAMCLKSAFSCIGVFYQGRRGEKRNLSYNISGYRSPREVGLTYEDCYIRCSDGVLIHAWYGSSICATDDDRANLILCAHTTFVR